MTPDALAAYVTAALARAPQITDARRDEITRHLRPGTQKGKP